MIAFVMIFHDDIIDIAFYDLAYMLMEDRIHGTLICRATVLQAERHYCIVVTPTDILKDVCFSSSGYIFI